MINNEFYEELLDKWHKAYDHPVALLRAENQIRVPWVLSEIAKYHSQNASLLDIGCGGGFLTNAAQIAGHTVTGIDLSESSLSIAHQLDTTKKVRYIKANAYSLPFPDKSFDVVSAMDVLEHVDNPSLLISEASRVLKKGGLFFFHTFNRNPFSYLLVIKGVEWFVKNTPPNMHIYSLFIKPSELKILCSKHSLQVSSFIGLRPKFFSLPFLQLLLTRKVSPQFSFSFSKSLLTGYSGFAKKETTNGSDHFKR
jgi:2-polyprenyl-6-hydroxyphenyl methylase/3-demethylubiquinone-9 3-methyltransferase